MKKQLEQKEPVQEYTYDGKKKRKRFNEDYVEEAVKQRSHTSMGNPIPLTEEKLSRLSEALKNSEHLSEKLSSSASKATGSTAFLRSIIRKATMRKDGEKSETPSEYQRKVIGLVNELDERQLEKLD